jgi:glycosyltransferase involved in cell wall biosynthesis
MVVDGLPLVSIITPVYNGAEYLEELIQSVRSQDYPNIEHLIIDDGSNDGEATISILRRHPHLRWWSQTNKGQYAAMNEGSVAAQGEVLCFVNADDLVSPHAVAIAVQYLASHPGMDGVFGITHYIDQNAKDQPYWLPFYMAPLRFYPYFAHVSHCSLYVKKRSVEEHGLSFNPSLRFTGDYEWMIRIHKAGLRIGRIYEELSRVRIHTDQASQRNRAASVQEARKVRKAQKINNVVYFLLSRINLLLLRVWKVNQMLREIGVRGMVTYLVNRNSHSWK